MGTRTQAIMKYWPVFDFAVAWILAVTFLLAGVPHWRNSYYFLGSVYAYQLTDAGTGQIVAMSLPLIQLGLASCLLTRLFYDAAHLSSLFLLCTFAVVQTATFLRGLDISCGCFGPGSTESIGWTSLSIVYGLLLLSCIRNAVAFLRQTAFREVVILTIDS